MGSTKIRLSISGATGRMGRRIAALALADRRFQLISGVERKSHPDIGRIIDGSHAPIVDNVQEIISKTDVLVDFSVPQAILKNAAVAAKAKVALVVGTTGLNQSQFKKLKLSARRIPIVFSPNMSQGVNTLFRLVEKAAKALGSYDIEIIEAHHNLKKDSPSGTALKLADIAAEASGRYKKHFVYGREGFVGARKKREIGILAIRAGDIVGDHTVLIGDNGERLELTHRAHSRDCLAKGAIKAAAWVAKKRPGLYSMFDVLRI
jgi:4-hydroxy-tetrahydrodipicolinate reductase